jgi:hypothetical protein
MRNMFVFYCLIATPLFALVLLARMNLISSNVFALLMFIYIFIYHPSISGLRLVQTGKISKEKFWLNFVPFWNQKYWSYLFFKM